MREVPGDLADRRRLAGAVDADHQQDRRLAAEVDRRPAGRGDLGEDLDQPLADRLAVGGTAPASTSCSSRSTTVAVVGAPASARISASSSRSQVSSSMRSKRLAEISSAQRLAALGEALAQAAEDAPRAARPPSSARRSQASALARAEVEDLLPAGRHRRGRLSGGRRAQTS